VALDPPGGEPLAVALGDVDGDGAPELWVITGEGRGRSREHALVRLGEGGLRFPLDDLKGDPADLALMDLDRDGRDDLVVFVPSENPVIVRGGDPLSKVDPDLPGLGLLKGVTRDALFHGDVDGDGTDELLVPAGNFARALHLDGEGRPVVVAQFNLDDAAASVSAAAAADLDGDGRPEVLLADRTSGRLVVLGQGGELPVETARVDLEGLEPRGLLVTDVDGNGSQDVLLWESERFATVQAGGTEPRLVAGHDYESPVKDAYLEGLSAGDVNADGRIDLVLLETNKHLVHIAAPREDGIHHVLEFPVYESRMFESSRRSSREPREVLVADVTGDGLSDVALLVHDRIIVYPQEPLP
jgi:hypothetical protein